MARVLIAWELGEAFGHLARCLRLAEGLLQHGHTVVLALKDVRLPGGHPPAPGITVLASPLTPEPRPHPSRQPINYADVLRHCGFASAQAVAARLIAWQGMFDLTRPDMLLADHAPTALLAARLAGIPHQAIGNGFTIPPDVAPWPSIRPKEAISDADLSDAEKMLDHVTDAAQKALGYVLPVRMRELFGAQDILDTFSELDHYGARASGCYVGPIGSIPQAVRVAWQQQGSTRVLAYLRPEVPGFQTLMQALSLVDAEVLCVAPGMKPEAAKGMVTRRLRIALTPVDLSSLLPDAHLAVSYGNSGFSTQALLAGVPLAMRPRHVEQALFAHRIEALGAGSLLGGRIDVDSVKKSLQLLLDTPEHQQAAHAFRDRHRDYSDLKAIKQSLSHIELVFSGNRDANHLKPARSSQESSAQCIH